MVTGALMESCFRGSFGDKTTIIIMDYSIIRDKICVFDKNQHRHSRKGGGGGSFRIIEAFYPSLNSKINIIKLCLIFAILNILDRNVVKSFAVSLLFSFHRIV